MRSKEAIAQDLVKRHKELKELVTNIADAPKNYGQDTLLYELLEELQAQIEAPANAAKAKAAQYEQQARETAALESRKTRG